jgi:hypothetical protein
MATLPFASWIAAFSKMFRIIAHRKADKRVDAIPVF